MTGRDRHLSAKSPHPGPCQSGQERLVRALFRTPPALSGGCLRAAPALSAKNAPVAQLDRASDYESEGRTFESFRARHLRQSTLRSPASSRATQPYFAQPARSRHTCGYYRYPVLFAMCNMNGTMAKPPRIFVNTAWIFPMPLQPSKTRTALKRSTPGLSDEERVQVIGVARGKVLFVIVTLPGEDMCRIISARKATRHEQDRYYAGDRETW